MAQLKKRCLRATIGIFAVLVNGCVSVRADEFDPVRDRIRAILVERSIPSVAVAVARDAMVLWEEGFGWADRENRVAATPHTVYSLASATKPITATAVMLLCERGKLDLDRAANEYLGEAKLRSAICDPAQATVKRLLQHMSGLGTYYQSFYDDEPDRPLPFDETIRRYGVLCAVPGERFHYSNLNYGLLACLVERASGHPYARFLQEEVFEPLGMDASDVMTEPAFAPQQAARYDATNRRDRAFISSHPGASDVRSTAHDLVRFAMFHVRGALAEQKSILTDASRTKIQSSTVAMGGDQYGLGWVVTVDPKGRRLVGHGGSMRGVAAQVTLVPKEKLAIVALSNRDTYPARLVSVEVCEAVLDVLVPGEVTSGKRAAIDIAAEAPETRSNALLGRWRGRVATYREDMPLEMLVKSEGNVHVRLGGELETLLDDVQFRDDCFSGTFQGSVGTEDAARRPHRLRLEVRLRNELLCGSLTVVSLPASRGGALPYWVELRQP